MRPIPDNLVQGIQSLHILTGSAATEYFDAWHHWQCPKDYLILREWQIADYIWFIEQGSARIYYRKGDTEVTEWLALDGEFFMSITSFFTRTPSRLIIHTLEPAELWGIHYNDFMRLADTHHSVERLLRKMVTGSLILSQQRMESIQFETAQQRYERLLANSPDIVQRVPLRYIASFLGITQETLSRIRRP